MEKIKYFLTKNIKKINVVIIFVVAIGMFLPYYLGYYQVGHDAYTHYPVINAYITAISNGDLFFPKILPNIANDFGYGTGLFYAPLSHYFVAIIYTVLNFISYISITTCLKITHIFVMLLAGLFMYKFSCNISKDKCISLLCAIIYMVFPYHLTDIYVREALGECFSFMFIPLIFNGLYELLFNNSCRKFYIYFIIGTSGMILTHTITTLYTAIICLIFLLINFKKVFNKKTIKSLLVAIAFILGITSFFWVPLVEQYFTKNVAVFEKGVMSSGNFVNSFALTISNLLPYGANQSNDGLQFYLTIPIVVLFLLSMLYLYKDKEKNKKLYVAFSIFAVTCLICTTKIIPWNKLPDVFLFIQFPWRLLFYTCFFMSLVCPLCLKKIKDFSLKYVVVLLVSFLICCDCLLMNNFTRLRSNDEIKNITDSYGTGANNEYFPIKVRDNFEYYENRDDNIIILSGDYEVFMEYKKTPFLKFSVNNYREQGYVELPLLYYKGYVATYSDDPNTRLNIKEGSNGFVVLEVNREGTITINYTKTKLSQFSYLVFSVSFLGFFVLVKRGEKNEK